MAAEPAIQTYSTEKQLVLQISRAVAVADDIIAPACNIAIQLRPASHMSAQTNCSPSRLPKLINSERSRKLNDPSEPQGCLSLILKLFGISPTGANSKLIAQYPYQRKDYLLSKGERAFFDVLQVSVGRDFLLFSKIRLADLIFVRSGAENRQSHFNRIQSKHIDFVLCSRDLVRPILAIELDDASHDFQDRQDRDSFVDSALAAAGLPILHVKARANYDANAVRAAIDGKLKN